MYVLSRIDFEDFDGRKGFACYADTGELVQLNVYVWHAWPVEHWQITALDCGHPLWTFADETLRRTPDLATRYAVCYTDAPDPNAVLRDNTQARLAKGKAKAVQPAEQGRVSQWTLFGEVGQPTATEVDRRRSPKHPKR